MMEKIRNKIISLILFLMILVCSSYSQFYKVYGYKTKAKNEAEIVYWTSYIARSKISYSFFGKPMKREGLWAHSLEVEYGISDRLTLAAYLDFEDPSGENLQHVRTRAVFFRYRFAEKGSLFFDTALYLEYYIPRKAYKDYEELEIRLILEKDVGDIRFIFNPIVEKKTSGSKVSEGAEFNYAFGIYCNKCPTVQPGIEFYGKFGELGDFKQFREQKHVIFSTVDLKFGSGFNWHLGAGIGLTGASDKLIFKSIFSYEF